MMATGSPRCRPSAWLTSPSTRGVPPRTSTRSTPTSAVSATPTNRPWNSCFEPENLTAIARGRRSPASPTSTCRLVMSVPWESTANAVPVNTSTSEYLTTRSATASWLFRELAPQPGNLGLRFAERVPDAFELGLEPREQAPGFAIQAVGPCAQRDQVPGVARGLPLAPSESRQRQAEQADQYLGRAAQMRELRHDAQGGAGAALPRPGHRVRLACCHHHAEFHGGPLRPEADHVAIPEDGVARDPLTVDEGAVFRAQVADAERLAVPHDGGVARGDVEIALGVEANIR